MAADVWLKHPNLPDEQKPWLCPAEAVDGWREIGWEPTDERPVDVNPVMVEMPREMFEPIPGPKPDKTTKTKPAAGANVGG